jgi:hypothetical protein
MGIRARIVLLVVVVLAALGWAYVTHGHWWRGRVTSASGVYSKDGDAAYRGSPTIHTDPRIGEVSRGEIVDVIWDTHGKDYWACYVRTRSGVRGWLLCTDLERVVSR